MHFGKVCVKAIGNNFMKDKFDTLPFYVNFDILQYIHFKQFSARVDL